MTAESPAGAAPAAPYNYADQSTPPPTTPISEVAGRTFEHVYEVNPLLMQSHVLQQTFPNWDTLRIMRSRHAYLDWMHTHWATKVISGESVLREIEAEVATNEC